MTRFGRPGPRSTSTRSGPTSALAAVAAPAELLAVVKADGYGHGAVPVARAALDAGADASASPWSRRGSSSRAGIEAPVLVLSEPVAAAAPAVVEHRLTPTVYTEPGIEALAEAVAERGVAAAPGAPEGRHRHAPGGVHAAGDAVALAAGRSPGTASSCSRG